MVRRLVCLILVGWLAGCSPSGPPAEPAAAIVDGHAITMSAYQARLAVSRQRDPLAGIGNVAASPAPTGRLEQFTIEQLIREEVVRSEAARRRITVPDSAVNARVAVLRQRAGGSAFDQALRRNGFTANGFRAYERALLTEVALVRAMASDRAAAVARELDAGRAFALVAADSSDDAGTASRGGDSGWLRPADLPEPALAAAVAQLPAGAHSGVIVTERGYVIATVLERKDERVHLAVLLVLAPAVDLYSTESRPAWFEQFIQGRRLALGLAGRIQIMIGSHASP